MRVRTIRWTKYLPKIRPAIIEDSQSETLIVIQIHSEGYLVQINDITFPTIGILHSV